MHSISHAAAIGSAIMMAFAAVPAHAQSSTTCDQYGGYEAENCLNDALATANDALNAAYQQAEAFIAGDPDTAAADKVTWKNDLIAAERAWVAYRDANCKFELIGAEWHNGSGTTAAQQDCVLTMTTQRTSELTERYSAK